MAGAVPAVGTGRAARALDEPHDQMLHRPRICFRLGNGGDVIRLQRLLGHTTLAMTCKYVTLQTRDLSAVHAQFSPLGAAIGGWSAVAGPENDQFLRPLNWWTNTTSRSTLRIQNVKRGCVHPRYANSVRGPKVALVMDPNGGRGYGNAGI